MKATWLALAVGAVLVIDVVAVACHDTADKALPPVTVVTTPPRTVPTVGSAPPPVSVTQSDNLVTLSGGARSIETTGVLGPFGSVRLSGQATMTADGDVVDAGGTDRGRGTLTADGTNLTVTADAITVGGHVRIQPSAVTLNTAGTLSTPLSLAGPVTVAAAHIVFQPVTGQTTTTTVAPVILSSPISLRAPAAVVSGGGLRFVNAPADLHVVAGEGDFSWAGSGSIRTSQGTLHASYLGVRAQSLDVMLHRSSTGESLQGTGLALQAYTDGLPQLRTPARIDVLGNRATTGLLGRRHAFVWTPRNLGSTYDMAILAIHPVNAAAGNVHLGLLPMPPMFGGEAHALTGGDSGGLKGGGAVDSLIARNGDDKRSIGYDALPPGTVLVLVVQGNFDPITVTVTTY